MTLESVGNTIIFKNATGMHVLIQPKKKDTERQIWNSVSP